LRAVKALRHLSPGIPLVVFVNETEESQESYGSTVFVSRIRASREVIAAIRTVFVRAQRAGRFDPP
jgi:hypothetical protein